MGTAREEMKQLKEDIKELPKQDKLREIRKFIESKENQGKQEH